MVDGIGGSITESGIPLRLGSKFVHYSQMSLLMNAGTSLGAGTPIVSDIADVAGAEQSGIAMTTADEVYGVLNLAALPRMPGTDMKCRIHTIVGEVTKSGMDWLAWFKGLAEGEAISDAKVSADASLIYEAQSNTLAGELVITPAMGMGLTTEFDLDPLLQFAIELNDVGTATADKVFLVGAEFLYTMKLTAANEVRQTT